jgi:hypothetical protein
MKRPLMVLSLAFGILLVAPAPEAAAWWGWSSSSDDGGHHWWRHRTHRDTSGVPELDPSAAGSALVLLLGGVAYIASRRREDDLV